MGRNLGALMLLTTVLLGTACAASIAENSDKGRVKRQAEDQEACQEKYGVDHTFCLPDNPVTALPLNVNETKYLVDKHNYERCRLENATDMLKVYWDDFLATSAQKWAEKCIVGHDNMEDKRNPDWLNIDIGQNMAFGHRSLEVALERWWNESWREDYNIDEPYSGSGGYGHFVQMATAQTTRIGCGRAYCENTDYKHHIVCNYVRCMDTQYKPYTPGPSCSACPDNCEAGSNLCDCGNKLCIKGKLNVTDCSCICNNYYTGENCSERICLYKEFSVCESFEEWQCDLDNNTIGGNTPFDVRTMCLYLCGECHDPCSGTMCINGDINMYTCKCECHEGWGGSTCNDDCAALCQQGTPSVDENGACQCDCYDNYSGQYCDAESTSECGNTFQAICELYGCPTSGSFIPRLSDCDHMADICQECCGCP